MTEDANDPFAGLTPLQTDEGGDLPPAPEGDGIAPAVIRACALHPLNDYGNGLRFRAYFGRDVLWNPRLGWFTWQGKVWQQDPDDVAVREKAQQLSGLLASEIPFLALKDWQMEAIAKKRAILDQLAAIDPADPEGEAKGRGLRTQLTAISEMEKQLGAKRREHRSFARTSGNTARIDAALREGGIGLARPLEDMDATPLDVNTQSGVLRFSVDGGGDAGYSPVARVDLVPHERDQLLTKILPVAYDPDATCPEFDTFFAEVQPDPVMRAFIMRWLGLSMTALPVQMFSFWFGAGANGKSVLADLVGRILGGYSASARIKSLTGVDRRGGGDATPDLMLLIGARYVRASEPMEGEALQEALIKELTGGEPMMVRSLHKDFVEFRPYFKLTISGNHKPTIRATDDGIWRRVLLVPWDVQIPEHRRDKDLGDRLFRNEAPGILNRLVAGLIDYLEGGIQVPDMVRDATREFREESDPVGTFLDMACVVTGDPVDSVGSRELGEAFNWWLSERGEGEFKPRTVAIRLKEKAGRWRSRVTGKTFVARKSSTMAYDGIRFTDTFGDEFRRLPRDSQGRILRGRAGGDA